LEKEIPILENDKREIEIIGSDEITGKPKQVTITSEDIRPILINFMQTILVAIETSINISPPEVSSDIAKNGMFLSGGLSSICGIQKYLSKKLNIPVKVVQDNENAVILSAGKLLSDRKTLNEIITNF
jgi:rod shape-determining protein MreB